MECPRFNYFPHALEIIRDPVQITAREVITVISDQLRLYYNQGKAPCRISYEIGR
jgi:hypothetical protein